MKCLRSTRCPCGNSRATEGSIYRCDEIAPGGVIHRIFCGEKGCEGIDILVGGRPCPMCSCCFGPLDDGDTSMVREEEFLTDDEILDRERPRRDAPAKKPTRVLV